MEKQTVLRKLLNTVVVLLGVSLAPQSQAQGTSKPEPRNATRVKSVVALVRSDSLLTFVTVQEMYDLYRGRTREIRGIILPAIHRTVASEIRVSFSTEVLKWKSVTTEISRIRTKVFTFEGNPPTEHPDEDAVFAAIGRVSGIGYMETSRAANLPDNIKAIPILEGP